MANRRHGLGICGRVRQSETINEFFLLFLRETLIARNEIDAQVLEYGLVDRLSDVRASKTLHERKTS